MNISEFYEKDYANSALYTSFRTVGSAIDGFKPSARKVFYTVDKKNIVQNYKVQNLAADVSTLTNYIHGAGSLEGVIVGMAQEFNNNAPLLAAEGSFGNRLNKSAASSRYIFTKKSKWFDKFFNETDNKILKYRIFEGDSIEPFYYVPIIPLILLNGSVGIGNGYAQKILPRKLESLTKAIQQILSGKKVKSIPPYVEGYNGSIVVKEGGRVEVLGKIRNEVTSIFIEEVPFSYDLESYVNELDKLVEKGIIKDYTDRSEDGKFNFEIKCTREFGRQEEADILQQLKLIDRMTENFTSVSADDSIIEFNNEIELLEYYVKVRLEYYIKRKTYLLQLYKDESIMLKNKVRFIESIMNDSLIIYKKTKTEVDSILVEKKFDKLPTYEYLLEMRIDTFTKEKLDKLKNQLQEKTTMIKDLSSKSEKDLWTDDLKGLI